ncbi:TraB/GumN family protein [Paraclostridium sordellii]|uniref:TraB/GumN family protein n=1 Tax=Paraclostridium sordellii TaxID=1505 RepID=UPI0005DA7B12|nr:TraB/GumN family protein [Paeniclostridium sordellii]CEN27111.1 GumN family protein [[Clostridium] sordellii] [Paeniclostridium sordellii]
MKKLNKIFLLAIAICIPIFFIGCSINSIGQEDKKSTLAKGFFWKATKGDDFIYLVGTMHPDKSNINYLNDTMKKIIKETDALALEINFSDENTKKSLDKINKENTYLKQGELNNLLTNKEQEKFKRILESLDFKYEDIKNLTPEAISNLIKNEIYVRAGFNGNTSDIFLQNIYNSNNKKIISLENINHQHRIISKNTTDLKKFINEFNAKTIEKEIKTGNEIMYAFITGDSNYMEKYVEDNQLKNKDDYNKLLKDRNKKMVEKIDNLIKENENYVVAVGTMHFFGNDSIVKLLQEKGYKVTKLKS